MSVKVHEAFSLDSFMDRLLWFDDFLGDQLKDEWRAAGGGSATVVDAQTGGIVRLTTAATSGQTYLIDWNVIRSLLVSKKVTMELRVKVLTNTFLDIFLYLYFDANNRLGFFVSELAGGATNWNLNCRDGGVSSSVDSGIAVDTDYHIFRIECFPTDEVHFYIDGVECANSPITTNIPDDAADFLEPYLYIRAREDVAKSMDVDYVVIRQEI